MGSRETTARAATSTMAPVIKEEIVDYDISMSKTDQYRKVMKPLIETSRVAPLTVRVPEQRVPKHMRVASPNSDCGYSSGRDSTPSPNVPLLPSSSHKEEKTVWRPF